MRRRQIIGQVSGLVGIGWVLNRLPARVAGTETADGAETPDGPERPDGDTVTLEVVTK